MLDYKYMKAVEGVVVRKKDKPSVVPQDKFKPTKAQRVWVEAALEMSNATPREISEACGVAVKTFYNWKRKEGFMDWYLEMWNEGKKRWIPELDSIGMKKARKGKFQYWREMQKIVREDSYQKGKRINMSIQFVKYDK